MASTVQLVKESVFLIMFNNRKFKKVKFITEINPNAIVINIEKDINVIKSFFFFFFFFFLPF